MKYSVKTVRKYYNDKAVIEQTETKELFYDVIDNALMNYNYTIIGEKVTGELHSYTGSSCIYVTLFCWPNDEKTILETTFLHNGEVQ